MLKQQIFSQFLLATVKPVATALVICFVALYSIGIDLVACFRIGSFLSLLFFLVGKFQSKLTSGDYLEQIIKVVLLTAYSAFTLTLFVSYESKFIRVVLLVLFPFIALLFRSIRFNIQINESSSWAMRSPTEIFLVVQAIVYWVMFLWGWKASLPMAAALTLIILIKTQFRLSAGMKPLIVGSVALMVFTGAILGRQTVQQYSSDYFLSYDQIFRGSISTGITRWGINNTNFGFGRQFPYHWLAESIAGMLARVGGISEIVSISRLTPFLGMMFFVTVCAYLLIACNASLPISVITLLLSSGFLNQLDPTSVGTLFGAAMFMATLLYVLTGVNQDHSYHSAILLALLTGLTVLSQSILGFVLAISIVVLYAIRFFTYTKHRSFYLRTIVLIILVSVVLQVIFFRTNSWFVEEEIIGFGNWLKFPGVPIQIGTFADSTLRAVRLNSLFFIFYLTAIFGLTFFSFLRADLLGSISRLFALQMLICFGLLNLVNLGWANGKFLAPISLLGTFLGFFTIMQFFKNVHRNRFMLLPISFVIVVSFILQLEEISAFLINTGKGLIFLFFIALAFGFMLLGVLQSLRFHNNKRAVGASMLTMMICSTVFILHNVRAWQDSRVFQDRTSRQAMFGSQETRDCLQFLKEETPKDSVIATSLWRIPGGTDEKYFLTSLLTHRLVILDGPVYSEMLNWQSAEYFERLKDIHTSFANSLDKPSQDRLVDLGATFFLLDTRFENPDRTWSNLVDNDVVFGNKDCSVIKL